MVSRLKEHQVEFVHEAREQPWRQMVIRVYDPDMNIVEIGESLEYLCFRLSKDGLTIEEISAAAGIPEEFVKNAVAGFSV